MRKERASGGPWVMRPNRNSLILLFCLLLPACLLPAWKTLRDMRPLPERLIPETLDIRKPQLLDRSGLPLLVTYQNKWNVTDYIPLHKIPLLLQQSFIEAEDRRFYEHGGVDWRARLHAVFQNVLAFRSVRGASTITEQVVRMIHPRPRTVWSRWIEGFEAARLEARFQKVEILEFYLNQVPYAGQRRGVAQAARLYFDRDLDTLSAREMLGLAVLVRAPAGMDLRHRPKAMDKGIARLALRLHQKGLIDKEQYESALITGWSLAPFRLPIEAPHFANYIYRNYPALLANQEARLPARISTTLDGRLQKQVQSILNTRIEDLRKSEVTDGAVLVVDHKTDEVLSWVNAGGTLGDMPGSWIDAVTTPRQPGSTLKPFLYALALEMGQTPATLIDDSPLAQAVGSGLHSFHNYSRTTYGLLRLRNALGNSLNIPAVRTIEFTGIDRFLERLHDLGFKSLTQPADHYGEGLALGNGEVTLFELVRAYAVLACHGEFRPLRLLRDIEPERESTRRIYSEEDASLIADILSDPQARRLEFGDGNLLRLPVQTAVKTGTSNDHRDAWAVGFSERYTVGVWMGNLDRRPTGGLTGTSGPGLVLRAVFAELNRYSEPRPLYLSPGLKSVTICQISGLLAGPHCPAMQEWFSPEKIPAKTCTQHEKAAGKKGGDKEKEFQDIHLVQPTPGLLLARDPRIPDELEAFSLTLPKDLKTTKVEWIVDGKTAGITGAGKNKFLWPLVRGRHSARARVWQSSEASEPVETPVVPFFVK